MTNQNNSNGSSKNSMSNQANNRGRANSQQSPTERAYLETLKEEIAEELGIDLKDPQLTAQEAGKVGGNMVKQMVQNAKQQTQSNINPNDIQK